MISAVSQCKESEMMSASSGYCWRAASMPRITNSKCA